MTTIRFEHVSKRFESRRQVVSAVEDLSLTIEGHEFFTLVGPSGCGKSTALNLIAGLERETEGALYFDGESVSHLEPKDRDVAMVFQSYALYPHMSVFQNIAFPLRIKKRPAGDIERSVREAASAVGIADLLERSPRELSGGQRQRVALARALVRRPRVFLMDEPLSNLDARLRLQMRGELKRIHEEWRITTVYVTHDQEEAMVLSDRLAVLRHGRVQQCDTPEEIYTRPANRFVAEFIGSPPINIVDGDSLAAAGFGRLFEGLDPEHIDCGIRPQDLTAVSEPPANGPSFTATVAFTELTGRERWVSVEWRGALLKALARGGAAPAPGDPVTLTVNPDDVLLFFKDSGARVGAAPRPGGTPTA